RTALVRGSSRQWGRAVSVSAGGPETRRVPPSKVSRIGVGSIRPRRWPRALAPMNGRDTRDASRIKDRRGPTQGRLFPGGSHHGTRCARSGKGDRRKSGVKSGVVLTVSGVTLQGRQPGRGRKGRESVSESPGPPSGRGGPYLGSPGT